MSQNEANINAIYEVLSEIYCAQYMKFKTPFTLEIFYPPAIVLQSNWKFVG